MRCQGKFSLTITGPTRPQPIHLKEQLMLQGLSPCQKEVSKTSYSPSKIRSLVGCSCNGMGHGPGAEKAWDHTKKTFYDPKKLTKRVQQRALDYFVKVNQSAAEDLIFIYEVGAVLNLTPA
jgi:hypothetical protein